MHPVLPRLQPSTFPAIRRGRLQTLQVNLGYRCNQACLHCHVNAGPTRTEMMSRSTADLVLEVLGRRGVAALDLTGGAPELNPEFRRLVSAAHARRIRVVDRCNLTVLFEPKQEDLADFLAAHRVEVVASLPCYSLANVDAQRGRGVFDKSIRALRWLNRLGYGRPDGALVLNLVYNPQGPALPPPQAQLEEAYRRELHAHFGVVFNNLHALANMPIQRFGSTLISRGQFEAYLELLKASYASANLGQVMCRHLISVDWQGYLYDCDFNQMLGLPLGGRRRAHLRDLLAADPRDAPVAIAEHCYGCTAGQGSSCGGALEQRAAPERARRKRP